MFGSNGHQIILFVLDLVTLVGEERSSIVNASFVLNCNIMLLPPDIEVISCFYMSCELNCRAAALYKPCTLCLFSHFVISLLDMTWFTFFTCCLLKMLKLGFSEKNQMTLTNKTQVLLNNADFTWHGQWNSGFTKQRGFHITQSQNAGFI